MDPFSIFSSLFFWVKAPRKVITLTWLTGILFVFIFFIIACVATHHATSSGGHVPAYSFAAIFTSLVLISISIIGTIVMRKYHMPLSIGIFLGISFVLIQQILIIFAFFVERGKEKDLEKGEKSSWDALATFTFFLFLIYSFFYLLLSTFKDNIIQLYEKQQPDQNEEIDDDLASIPPEEEY